MFKKSLNIAKLDGEVTFPTALDRSYSAAVAWEARFGRECGMCLQRLAGVRDGLCGDCRERERELLGLYGTPTWENTPTWVGPRLARRFELRRGGRR